MLLQIHGSYNHFGYDSGLDHTMKQDIRGLWQYDFMTEWPSHFQCNVWGSNPDGQPDLTRAFGDIDSDGVLDLLSPVSLLKNVVNLTSYPPPPYVSYHITYVLLDATVFRQQPKRTPTPREWTTLIAPSTIRPATNALRKSSAAFPSTCTISTTTTELWLLCTCSH